MTNLTFSVSQDFSPKCLKTENFNPKLCLKINVKSYYLLSVKALIKQIYIELGNKCQFHSLILIFIFPPESDFKTMPA